VGFSAIFKKLMAEKLSHRERIAALLAGETPDRFAASIWRHFFHRESTIDGLVEAMVQFQKQCDWDFMKINPRADYHIEDWGLKQIYSKNEFERHTKTAFPINTITDWDSIRPLNVTSGVLGDHLIAVSKIRKEVGKELPLLMTIFTPLAIAGRMVQNDQILVEHLHKEPERVMRAVRVITDTFKTYAEELRNAGADGIFLATTSWASRKMLSWEEYQRFALPYDLELASATGSDALNLFHVCGTDTFLAELLKQPYPCQLINWDASEPTNLPIDRAEPLLGKKVAVGGMDHQGWFLHSEPDEIQYQVDRLKERFSSKRLIFGPGCTIDPKTKMQNLLALRERL
jgi:uroporphyrinogen decarboxylase